MKTLYLDCSMGAAGDMLMGALYDLLSEEQQKEFLAQMENAGFDDVHISAVNDSKCGIQGTHIQVLVDGVEEHQGETHEVAHHHSIEDVKQYIDGLHLPIEAKEAAKKIYEDIAAAESKVHGEPVGEVHFHEVGMKDAIADVLGCVLLMQMHAPDQVVVSPVNVGFGTVRCAHGVVPVPAPATLLLLQGMETYAGEIQGELCTPTGAALLVAFRTRQGHMPNMTIQKVGYGTGNKDFVVANVVRAVLGTTEESESTEECVWELSCNIDDMTAEEMGYVSELLMDEGAKDVYTTAVGMKKGRPGILLTVICAKEDKEKLTQLMFEHTSTIGIREAKFGRMVLKRQVEEVAFSLGKVRVKNASGYGVEKVKPEYEDVKRIAKETGLSLNEVKRILLEETGL